MIGVDSQKSEAQSCTDPFFIGPFGADKGKWYSTARVTASSGNRSLFVRGRTQVSDGCKESLD